MRSYHVEYFSRKMARCDGHVDVVGVEHALFLASLYVMQMMIMLSCKHSTDGDARICENSAGDREPSGQNERMRKL